MPALRPTHPFFLASPELDPNRPPDALAHATSETDTGNSIRIVFHEVNNAGTEFSWEVRFGAKGIDGEVRKTEVPAFNAPIPGMSFIAAITALFILVLVKKR